MTEQDRIESALLARLAALYGEHEEILKKKLRRLLEALQRLENEPQGSKTDEEQAEWAKKRFSVLLRQHNAEKVVSEEMSLAGEAATALISAAVLEIFAVSYKENGERIIKEAASLRNRPSFPTQTDRMIRNILDDTRDYFTEQSFTNLRKNKVAVQRYRKALAKATRKGETHQELVQRFMDIIGDTSRQAHVHASLLAQTERTRAQSEANEEIANQAAAQGLRLYDEWLCAMIPPHKTPSGWSSGSRESHKELHHKKQMHGQPFHTVWGNDIRFPGDPEAPARERCNCHCVKTSHVLLDGYKLIDGEIVKV